MAAKVVLGRVDGAEREEDEEGMLRMKMNVRLGEGAVLPRLATGGAAGYDLCASEPVVLVPGAVTRVKTGVSAEIPPFLMGSVRGRSGLASKGIRTFHGTIDSDYRGEIQILLTNDTPSPFQIESGDRVAQVVFLPIARPELVAVSSLSSTDRGSAGFGSTGKN